MKKKEPNGEGKVVSNAPGDEETLSNVTKQKVAAAKQYIENHYKEQMKNLQERKERYGHRNILTWVFVSTLWDGLSIETMESTGYMYIMSLSIVVPQEAV